MAVYRDKKTGTWRAVYRYTDWQGKRKQTQKRGFSTKRDAIVWEAEQKLKSAGKLDMTFGSFYELYSADVRPRLKESTWDTKEHIVRTKIMPFFGERKIEEIDAKDVIAWQNKIMSSMDAGGRPYSHDYLKTIHAQLSAIFNHAVRFYNLPYNPAQRAGEAVISAVYLHAGMPVIVEGTTGHPFI